MPARFAAAAAVATTCAATLVLLPSSASAEEVNRFDRRGDAPAAIDITKAKYEHATNRVRTRIRVPDLGKRGRAGLSISDSAFFEPGVAAVIRKRPGTAPVLRLFDYDHFDAIPRACAGLKGSWKRSAGVIRISVPRRCLGDYKLETVYAVARTVKTNGFDEVRHSGRLDRD